MEIDHFWEMMDELSKTNNEEQHLEERLKKMTVKDIIHFDHFLEHFSSLVHRNDKIWGELRKNDIWASDDGYYYFTAWLVSRGIQVFEEVMNEPEKVIKYTGKVQFAPGKELLFYIPSDVVEEKMQKIKNGTLDDKTVRLLGLFEEDLEFGNLKRHFKKRIH